MNALCFQQSVFQNQSKLILLVAVVMEGWFFGASLENRRVLISYIFIITPSDYRQRQI